MSHTLSRLGRALAVASSVLALAACAIEPERIPAPEVLSAAIDDQQLITQSTEPLTQPLTMSEAVARALKFNLAHRVQLMETALANKSFELAKMDMLPILAAEGGVTARDNYDASRSMSVLTGQESLEPSTSQEKTVYNAAARFSWNILDFGISYLQANQEADRYLITELSREKAMQQMASDVRTAYWRAAALKTVADDIEALLANAAAARDNLDRVREQRLRTPLVVLEDARALSEVVLQLETMRQSVKSAQVDLASLINAPPGTEVPLAVPEDLPELPPLDRADMSRQELLALVSSGDYAAQLYNARIEHTETQKAILRMMPGVELFSAYNWNSNDFLYNNTWAEVGARVNWNIMRLLAYDEVQEHAESREQLAVARRLATNMAVITRLRLAAQAYDSALVSLDRARDMDDIDTEIRSLTRQAEASDATDSVARIKSEVRALRSRVAFLLAYAAAQDAYGKYLTSLGLSPVPADYQARSVEDLAAEVRSAFDRWDRGELPGLPPELEEVAQTAAAVQG